MDSLNPSSSRGSDRTPRVAADGLVLWRVYTPKQESLWCLVFDLSDGFHLVIDSDPFSGHPPTLVEHHPDIIEVVNRAAWWLAYFQQRGCGEVDVD